MIAKMYSEFQKELIQYLKRYNMKNLINYWQVSGRLEKLNLISYFLKFPFFVIHELSHIVIAYLSGKYFEIKEFKFFEIKDGKLTVFSMCLEVHGETDFYVVLGAIMPNITYYSILITSCIIAMMNPTWITVLTYVYILYGIEVGTCSDEDRAVFKKFYRKKIIGLR